MTSELFGSGHDFWPLLGVTPFVVRLREGVDGRFGMTGDVV
jgi:hypothetical protein